MSLPKHLVPYWSPPFQFFYVWTLWGSVLSTRVPECQKAKEGGLDQHGPNTLKCSHLTPLGLKWLNGGLICISVDETAKRWFDNDLCWNLKS